MMFEESILLDIFYYLGATVILVPLFKALGLGAILGYICSGLILGPAGIGLLDHSEDIKQISDFGIIMLLFVIGLELSPSRLSKLKGIIFKEGIPQFFVTTALISYILTFFGVDTTMAIVAGSSLSLSSTAFALYYLKESDQLTKSYGQSSFSILLFQDLIIIPILTVLPFFAESSQITSGFDYRGLFINIQITLAALLFGMFALIPAISWIYKSQSREIFISCCLMMIIGSALLMEFVGLSKALGSFMAGIFLTNSKLRHDISTFSVPLKSMLMGVFFMAFGLSIDTDYFKNNVYTVVMLTLLFTSVKFLILMVIGRVKTGRWSTGMKMGILLGQGGEFGLLIISTAVSHSIIATEFSNLLISSITLSLFLSPLFTKIVDYLNVKVPAIEEKSDEEFSAIKDAS